MILWPLALSVFILSPTLGAVLLGLFSLLGLPKTLAVLRARPMIALILLSQFSFHFLCLIINAINELPLYTPLTFTTANLLAFLLALANRQNLERQAHAIFLFLLLFLIAVVLDFSTRQPTNGLIEFISSFRFNLELLGREVGPNVFAYSLVLVTVICYNFTSFNISLKRIVGALCFLGLILVSARIPLLITVVFLTFLCEDWRTRRYWVPAAVILTALLFWSLPDLLSSTRFARVLDGSDTSTETRTLIYFDFFRLFDNFFWGHGHGAYFQATGLSLHNDFVEIMYSSGVVGFVLFYGGQFATYVLITDGGRIIDRRVMSLFLLQFGFSVTESLSI